MQLCFQAGYATIKEATPIADRIGDYDLLLGAPNEEMRRYLSSNMVTYLLGQVHKPFLHSYGEKLQKLDFEGAKDNLSAMLQHLDDPSLPSNENQFSGYALHLLREARVCVSVCMHVGVVCT